MQLIKIKFKISIKRLIDIFYSQLREKWCKAQLPRKEKPEKSWQKGGIEEKKMLCSSRHVGQSSRLGVKQKSK